MRAAVPIAHAVRRLRSARSWTLNGARRTHRGLRAQGRRESPSVGFAEPDARAIAAERQHGSVER
jgi:hypothetical protein